jgi:hypothetical protein
VKMKKLNLVLVAAFGLVLVFSSYSVGQFTISAANAQPLDPTERFWNISTIISTVGKGDITNITLLDANSGLIVKFADTLYFDSGTPGRVSGFRVTNVVLSRTINYVLIVSVIKRKPTGELDKVETANQPIAFQVVTPAAPVPRPATILKAVKSTSKKDSDFYFAGEIVKTSGVKTAYTTEIKIEPRFGRGLLTYSPFFHINTSTDPDADPDTMDIGFKVTRSFPFNYEETDKWQPRLTSVYLSVGGKIESTRDFDNTNFIVDPTLDFVISPFPIGKKATFTIDPIVGVEVGKNLNSPLPAAKGAGIARILGGLDMLLDIPIEHGIDGITLSGAYTRRWLLKRELGFKVNDDKTLSLTEFGKSPRDFVEAKIDFNINKFFGPYIAYDWGQVPPSYKLLDHRVRIGLTYKFKLSN